MKKKIAGFAGLFLATAVCAAVMLACNEDSPSGNAGNTSDKKYKIAEVFKTDNCEFTVVSANAVKSFGSKYMGETAPEGALFLAVVFKSKNVSSAPLASGDIPEIKRIIDPNGTEYDEAFDATISFCMVKDIDSKIISRLNPGVTERNAVVFEISSELWEKTGWTAEVSGDGKYLVEIK